MKLALAGGYGHCIAMLKGAAAAADVQFVAAAKYGPDDPCKYLGLAEVDSGQLKLYDDWRQMLDEVQPDIVGVFMPLYLNAEVSIAAAQRGCHVVAEKPLATTLADLAKLKQAVEAGGVEINMYMQMRCQPCYQAVKQAVQAGRIGEPILAAAQKSYEWKTRDDFFKSRQTYGGSILWVAIHALDYVSYCTGKDYTSVCAMQSNKTRPTHPGCEDNGGLLLSLVGGGHAAIWFDYLRPWAQGVQRRHGDDRLRIAGSEGVVEILDEGARVQLLTPTGQEDLPLPDEQNLFGRFVDSITGRGKPIITTAESLRITEVALKARQSADDGKIIDLAP